jgi:penicillin amidase
MRQGSKGGAALITLLRTMRRRFIAVLLAATALSCTPGPDPDRFEGLSADVRIRRDDFGLQHIEGATARDAMYGAGYAQAVDRLWQMDMARRRALGRRAEVLPDRAADDALLRHFDFAGMGRANAERMRREHPETHALIVAWLAGVNARIREVRDGRAPLPYGFSLLDYRPEEWSIEDPYAIAKLILFNNAGQLEYDLLGTILERFVPEFGSAIPILASFDGAGTLPPEELPPAGTTERRASEAQRTPPPPLPPDAAERLARFAERVRELRPGASNNWAVDGRHTANGRPLIAGDPHQPLQSPTVFYMQHLRSDDGELDVAGFSFVGTPFIQLGHNRHVVWTATTTYPDWADLVEARYVDDRAAIEIGGERHTLVRREEVVQVRDGESRTVVIESVPGLGVILPTDFAPLPITRGSNPLFFRWTGFVPTIEADAFFELDKARSIEEFEAAVDRMEIGAFNFVAADAEGIAYRSRPLVPDRGAPGTFPRSWVLIDGVDPASRWTGAYLPPERLPTSRGGARGWIATANNDPFGFMDDGSIDGDAFYYGVWHDPGTRAARIDVELARLVDRGSITPADFEMLQMDTYSMFAERFLPALFDAADALATDPALEAYRERTDLAALIERLRAWDRRMDRDSSDALVFHAWVYYVMQATIGDDLSVLLRPILDASTVYVLKFALFAIERAPRLVTGGVPAALYGSLDRTAQWLTTRFGGIEAERYTWADFHGNLFTNVAGGEFDRGWYATDGGDGTVNVSDGPFFRGDDPAMRVEADSGAIYRMVAGFRDDGMPEARVTFAVGHSAEPDSPYWENTHARWIDGEYVPLAFDEADIEARTVERFVLDESGLRPQ